MKFRVRLKNGKLYAQDDIFLSKDGKIYSETLCGLSILDAKAEFLVGKDIDGEDVFENDVLSDSHSTYKAGLDLDIGAILICENGAKIPFKYLGLKKKSEDV